MEGKKHVKRLSSGERMASILRHWEEFYDNNIVPAKEFAPELWKEIREKLKDKSSKASSAEQLSHLERFEECLKNEEKNLLADFEQSNKKCLEAKAEPFKMKNNKEKKAFVKPNMPEKVNKNKTPPNNNKLNTTNNRNNQNKNERQNQKFQRSVSVSPEQRYNNNNNTGTKAWANRQPSVFRKNNNDRRGAIFATRLCS
jgi:hypothetical protein